MPPRKATLIGRLRVTKGYSVAAWTYEAEPIPYIGVLKGRRPWKEIRLDKAARPVILSALTAWLGPLGLPSAKATQAAAHIYSVANAV